jgi:hypothetical protein
MAAGKPIVCSDIHGYKGVVRRDEQALLVPPKDVKALTEALTTILRDPQMRAGMGASGRERVIQYGWENITAKVEEYYRFVMRRVASHGPLPPHVSPNLGLGPRVAPVGPGRAIAPPTDENEPFSPLRARG